MTHGFGLITFLFNKAYKEEVNLDDVRVVSNFIEDQYISDQARNLDRGPLVWNAFEMITLSQGLNLSPLFSTDVRIMCKGKLALFPGNHQMPLFRRLKLLLNHWVLRFIPVITRSI